MKSIRYIFSLLTFVIITSSTAVAAPQVGVMLGSDSGINAKFGDIKIGVGLDDFSITVDKMINLITHRIFTMVLVAKLTISIPVIMMLNWVPEPYLVRKHQ